MAELDDITAVAFLALIFAILPALQTGNESSLAGILVEAGVIFVVKAVAFGALCLILARYAERPIVKFIKGARAPGPILLVAGIGILIAGVAGLFGFSLAIGALFAGLVFSRDLYGSLSTRFGITSREWSGAPRSHRLLPTSSRMDGGIVTK